MLSRLNHGMFGLCLLAYLGLCSFPPHYSFAQEGRPSRDPIVIQVIHLEHADAEQLASVLAHLLSPDGRVVPYSPTNSLIIRDRASVVKKLIKIIKGSPDP